MDRLRRRSRTLQGNGMFLSGTHLKQNYSLKCIENVGRYKINENVAVTVFIHPAFTNIGSSLH